MSIAVNKTKLAVLQVTIAQLVPLTSPILVFDLLESVVEALADDEEAVGFELYEVIHLLSKIGFVTNSHYNARLKETSIGPETTVCPNKSIREFLKNQKID